MPDMSGGLVGVIVFILIVAVAVVLGITINEHAQAWIDGSGASSSTA